MTDNAPEIDIDRESGTITFLYADGSRSRFTLPPEAMTDEMIAQLVERIRDAH